MPARLGGRALGEGVPDYVARVVAGRDGIADASPSHLNRLLRWGFGVDSVPKDESALNVVFPSDNTEGTSG